MQVLQLPVLDLLNVGGQEEELDHMKTVLKAAQTPAGLWFFPLKVRLDL